MTLPKGYKPGTPSRDDEDNNSPRKKSSAKKAIFFLILFLISLAFFINSVINYIEHGKEVDEQKKILDQVDKSFAEAFHDIYGRYPTLADLPPNN
jgi:hypothetical protein